MQQQDKQYTGAVPIRKIYAGHQNNFPARVFAAPKTKNVRLRLPHKRPRVCPRRAYSPRHAEPRRRHTEVSLVLVELGDDEHAHSLVEAAEAAQPLAVGRPVEAHDGLGRYNP